MPLNVLVLGEKARAGLERQFQKQFVAVVTDHSKLKKRTFKENCILADLVLKSIPFTQGEIFYNQFKNMISFETTSVPLLSADQLIHGADGSKGEWLDEYEMEGDEEIMQDFFEFQFAAQLGKMLSETDMVEFSQRVTSMGNSSKSAEDMLSRLKLLYNRSRQAKITTELIEIISGASAADDQKKEK